MALVFVPQHTVTYQSFTGTEFQWEVDILRSYDNTGSTPSWVSQAPTQLIGTGEPANIEWLRDFDVYKPIQGSVAKVNLQITNQADYDAWRVFSAAGRFEYQVRIRYRRPGETTLRDYWCGFIDAVDGQEAVNTFPFQLGFTAVDGLGRLEDTQLAMPVSQEPENLFTTLLEAVYDTGLNLPVYVDSGITQGGVNEALTTVTANAYYRYTDEDKTTTLSRKEFIEGLLSAFNCKITQSHGRWYIFNASTHGGTGADETKTWAVYSVPTSATAYSDTPTTDTENLRLVIDGSETQDLVPANQDLQLNTRRPVGSVECVPEGFIESEYVTNGCFDTANSNTDIPGYGILAGAHIQTFNRVTDIQHPTCTYALRNERNELTLNNRTMAEDVWFVTDYIEVDVRVPMRIQFDHLLEALPTGNFDNARLNWSVELQTYSTSTGQPAPQNVVQDNSYGVQYSMSGAAVTSTIRSLSDWYWHHGDQEWVSRLDEGRVHNGGQNHNHTIKSEELTHDDISDWKSVNTTLSTFNRPGTDSRIRLIFWYATGKSNSFRQNQDRMDGSVIQLLTNIRVNNEYASEITNPTYERVQEDYTQTIDYSPIFADNAPSAVYQRLLEDGYKRNGVSGPSATLEEEVTQLKLNDFSLQFQYYEGTLINLGTDPLGPRDKILLNWGNFQSSPAGTTISTSCIFNGGTFNTKANQFDCAFYVPDQNNDVASGRGTITDGAITSYGFFEHNVDLIAETFPGRSNVVVHQLGLLVDGLDGPIATGSVASATGSLKTSVENGVLVSTGLPGQRVTGNFMLVPEDNFSATASSTMWFNGDNSTGFFSSLTGGDTPEAVNSLVFSDVGRNIQVDYDLILPVESEFEELHIVAETDPFTGDTVSVPFTLTTSRSGHDLSRSDWVVIGDGGVSTIPIIVIISPPAGQRYSSTAGFSTPSTRPDYLAEGNYTQFGDAVIWNTSVAVPETAPTTVNVQITVPNTITAIGGTTSNTTINFTDNLMDASIGLPTQLVIPGTIGTSQILSVPIYAAPGFGLDLDNFAVNGLSSNNTSLVNQVSIPENTAGDDFQLSPAITLPLLVRFTAGGGTANITLNGSAQGFGLPVFDYELNVTNDIDFTNPTSDIGETLSMNAGQSQVWTRIIRGNDGYNLRDTNITFTPDAGWSASNVGPDAVEIRKMVDIDATNPMSVVDNVTLSLEGTLTREPYTLIVNLTNNISNTTLSQSVLSFGYDDGEIGSNISAITSTVARTLTIASNSNRMAFINENEIASVGDVSIEGDSPSISGGVITFRIEGSVPTPDDNGVSVLNVTIDSAGAINNIGSPALLPATSASIAQLTSGINPHGGVAEWSIDANGTFNVQIELTISNSSGADVSLMQSNGSYSHVVSGLTSGQSLTYTGSYGPITGDANTNLITLQAGELPVSDTTATTPAIALQAQYRLVAYAGTTQITEIGRSSSIISQRDAFGLRTLVLPNVSNSFVSGLFTGSFSSLVQNTLIFNGN